MELPPRQATRQQEAAPRSGQQQAETGNAPLRVIFVCTHNSARSIMAEALLRERGGDRFEAHSAGTEATEVRPLTLRVLEEAGIPTAGLRSKSVAELADRHFDLVVTVCDSARRRCPAFPGEGRRLHWECDDPAAVEGDERERLEAFRGALATIGRGVDALVAATAPPPG